MNTESNTQLFIRFLSLVLVLLICDHIIGGSLKYAYFRQHSGALYRTTYALDKTKANVLVIGSSRANHHYYIPQNDTSFYNAGKDGTSVLYHMAVLKSVLKRYTPEKIILDLDVSAFRKAPENYDRLSDLLPYYDTHPEIRDIIHLKSPHEQLKMISSIYPFNSKLLGIVMGNMQNTGSGKKDLNGYIPLMKKWNGSLRKVDRGELIDTVLVKAFEEILTCAKVAGSQVHVVVSPVYYKYDRSHSIEIAQKLCNINHVQLLDYSRDTIFLGNHELFADPSHLNDYGAKLFSANLADRIKNYHYGKS